jgi:hypothetical protein
LTRASIVKTESRFKAMDGRVKPGHDGVRALINRVSNDGIKQS